MKEITIAFGNEIQLATDKKTGKDYYVRISTEFRNEQLRELKGAALSVLLCMGLHANEKGECWVSNKTIMEETGYALQAIKKAKKFLEDKKYLHRSQRRKEGRFTTSIYVLFSPLVENQPTVEAPLVEKDTTVPLDEKTAVVKSSHGTNYISTEEEPGKGIEEKPGNIEEVAGSCSKEPSPAVIQITETIKSCKVVKIPEARITTIVEAWLDTYKTIDIATEIKKADCWLLSNPNKRYHNYSRFLTNWFNKTLDYKPVNFTRNRFDGRRQYHPKGEPGKYDGIEE
ncbi:MAG: helix-turn-helix domain-containing protein [Elusimicrobiota bacterium]